MRWRILQDFYTGEVTPKTTQYETNTTTTRGELHGAAKEPLRNVSTIADLDRLALAVSKHETADCTKGYGAEYSNCHGIKNGSIYPCSTGRNRMCIFQDREESFTAFKLVWGQGYGGRLPTIADARVYSGNDRAEIWLANVLKFYNDTIL